MQCGCVICLDRFDDAVGIVATECGHIFHFGCLDKWLDRSSTCPECRSTVYEKMVTKLFFNFSLDSTSDNNSDRNLDTLKELLHAKELECSAKNDQIMKLYFLQVYREKAEQTLEKMHRERTRLQNEVSKLKREIQKLNRVKAKNQKLLLENNNLENELEHLNNVKTIVEGCLGDAQKILHDLFIFPQTVEGKVATEKIATYCSVIKRELTRSKEEKTQLQNELIQLKRKMGIVQADNAKNIRLLERKIRHLEEQNKYLQDSISVSSGIGCITVTPGLVSNSSQSNHLRKSAVVCAQSHDGCSKCDEKVTPITVDFPGNKRQKLNVVVID